MIYLQMPVGGYYGWAICGKYLLREFAKRTEVGYIEEPYTLQLRAEDEQALVSKYAVDKVDGTLICTVEPKFSFPNKIRGKKNIGYVFYEWNTIPQENIENAKKFDIVVSGSEWNKSVLEANGINTVAIPQGVDQSIFKYRENINKKFMVFIGGKWEYRKAQDLAIKAYKIALEKYDDILGVVCSTNIFADNQQEIYDAIKGTNITNIGLLDHQKISVLMGMTDVGLFLNRCEGGTNLVLMEYLSTGRSAVVNTSTGQKDVSDKSYCYEVNGTDEQVVEAAAQAIIKAYEDRQQNIEMGKLAHEAMGRFSWGSTAEKFLALV